MAGTRRNVFLDMGANWANTLRLWRDVVADGREKPWEVYAFEASPLIQPYMEEFTDWLNGAGPKPNLTVPPAGSSANLKKYAERYGCTTSEDVFRECLWMKFQTPLAALKPNPALNSTALVRSRLADAGRPATRKHRYTFVPAAVAAADGSLQLGIVDANQMIRGGAVSTGDASREGVQMVVPMVNVVDWMIDNFREEDFVFLKLDAEGVEHQILSRFIDRGKFGLIDVLLMECHSFAGNCKALMGRVKDQARKVKTKVMTESRRFPGYDSCSTPDRYAPADPGAR